MSSFKVKVLNILDRFLTNRVVSYSSSQSDVRKNLFFEQLEERAEDIYIITFLKSGTTWMQMICYQLLTDGNMDFKHIYDVSPWLSNAATTGGDVKKINDLPSPRFFKCHDSYDKFDPKAKGRFIFVYRDGEDVAVSLFHHVRNYNDPEQTLEKTYEDYFSLEQEYNWFTFTESWLKNVCEYDILFVNYSDLKNDFDRSLRRIAEFLGAQLTDEIFQRVKERSSFDFMKKHEDKFGEQPTDIRVYDQFIREGKIGSGKQLNGEQRLLFRKKYVKHVKAYEHQLNPRHDCG
ncbi:MAG: sulfotransferase domain-containing protein [Flavobacteriales bacterium]|nr:sulfotransferase domain-containing protein [Flavobacteriales bacterium]